MALKAMIPAVVNLFLAMGSLALKAMILAVVNLFLAMVSNRSMAFLIFLVMIGFAVVAAGRKRRIAVVAAGRKRRIPESISTSSSLSGINYEVFLSFRGADTRKGFTDHLYIRLVDAGIEVFRDDEKLNAGEGIKPQLIKAIKGSKISIAVFSKDYASSRSCLMEAEHMWECSELHGQTIIPIFYDISPNDVKRQAGDFKTSFEKHEADENVDSNAIKTWKKVLRKIGGLSGFNREDIDGGHEAKLVEKILTRVRQLLKKDDQLVTDKLVGIDLHVQEIMRKLGVVSSDGQVMDRRVVEICGMPGVGKTTLAKVVYNKIHGLFDGCSFLEGINSRRVEHSQEMLIASLQKRRREALNSSNDRIKKMKYQFSNMKVLIVLDDVHNDEQVEALARELAWFGPGSRIIVTTNIQNVVDGFGDELVETYKVKPMRGHHALQLFRKHALEGYASRDVLEYDSLSIDIVQALGGLPMAIVLQAKYLKKMKNIVIWRSIQDSLKNNPVERKVEAASNTSSKRPNGRAWHPGYQNPSPSRTWANVAKLAAKGYDLAYSPPTFVDGKPIVHLGEEVLEAFDPKWHECLVGYYVGKKLPFKLTEQTLM